LKKKYSFDPVLKIESDLRKSSSNALRNHGSPGGSRAFLMLGSSFR